MDGLGTLPRIGQLLVCRCTNVTRDQRVHCLVGDVSGCLTCTGDLGDLCIKDALLVRVDFECSQHIDLLDQ